MRKLLIGLALMVAGAICWEIFGNDIMFQVDSTADSLRAETHNKAQSLVDKLGK